ncbi:MAG TPA: VacJ family lipoprotein [Dongiaceae bacterium]|jgi:phospholipid-binding lipoprotein MlaA|nr:VacJ family lipoprotein [Dongiaceae bacterium]
MQAVIVIGVGLILAGCAAKPNPNDQVAVAAYQEANDPIEPVNRYFFEVNHFVEEILIKPFAGWYRIGIPDPVQDSIRNFLRNLNTPVTLANDLLQGSWDRAGTTAMRFLINTTLGIGGIFDWASDWGYKYHEEDFGQTLAVWGVDEGPYLVLPLLGPSNPRDAFGQQVVDNVFDAPFWLDIFIDKLGYLQIATQGTLQIDTYSRNMQALSELQRGSVDYYATLRSLYRQHRNDEIRNGVDTGFISDKASDIDLSIPQDGAEAPYQVTPPLTQSQLETRQAPAAN